MRIKLIQAIERLCRRLTKIAEPFQSPVTGEFRDHLPECEALHDVAMAATAARTECEQECDALRQIEDAAWLAYWECESP